jgi:hypothetical protein
LDAAQATAGNQPKKLDYTGTPYVYLPGVSGSYLSVPSESAFAVTDLDVRAKWAFDDWTPAASSTIVGRYTSAGNQRAWILFLDATGKLNLQWSPTGTATTVTVTSTVATGVADGTAKWVRATLDADNGAVGNDVRFYLSDDGVAWTQLGTTVTTAGVAVIFAPTSIIHVGGLDTGSVYIPTGKFYRAIVKNGIDGPTVLDVDTSVIGTGAATTFNALTGQAVTINRSTAGRKSVAVVAPVWLFGTDDYMEVPDSDLLDFGATDSFTIVAAYRRWAAIANTPAIAKSDGTTAGWMLTVGSGGALSRMWVHDGTNNPVATMPAVAAQLTTLAGVRSAGFITAYSNGVAGTAVADTTTATLANANAMRVGRLAAAGTSYTDMEFTAAAVFRRVLTAAEITQVSDWMKGRAY